jgi:hypothetical protein
VALGIIQGSSTLEMGDIMAKCTTVDAAMTANAALTNDIRAKLKGDYNVSRPGLAIGSTKPNVANAAFDFTLAGVRYSKAAIAAGTALSGVNVPLGTFGAYRLEIGANGTIDIVEAAANATGYASALLALAGLPTLTAAHAEVGTVTASKSDAVFDPGTTDLDAANTTVAYADGETNLEAIGAAVS